jgi:hypothetical protein
LLSPGVVQCSKRLAHGPLGGCRHGDHNSSAQPRFAPGL